MRKKEGVEVKRIEEEEGKRKKTFCRVSGRQGRRAEEDDDRKEKGMRTMER